jgi:colanic acid biosynthesis glycosyl transferase WcaI
VRILFIEPYYEPDGGPAAPLFTMLCQELVRRGHEVTALTAVPHYPSGKVPQAYRTWRILRSRENGVEVVRLPLPSVDRSSLAQRMLQFSAFQIGAVLAGRNADCDVFIAITPSLEVWLPFHYFSMIRGKPAVYSVHDVYPDSGVQLGIFRHKPIIQLMTYLEQGCAQRAAIVRILSQSFAEGIRRLGVPEARIRLIYDWVDTDLITPLPKSNPFAIEHGLDLEFVVLYAGNMGFSQGLEHVLEAAQMLVGESIRFLFIGEGAAKESLLEFAASRHLPNVKFLPFQPRARLPEVLATADVSLVTLRKGMGVNSLPSKTLSILASGRPMIVSIDPDSDTWSLVQRAQSGICIPPENPTMLAEAILALKRDHALCAELAYRGRQYALRYHSPGAAADAFENILNEAIAGSSVQGHRDL